MFENLSDKLQRSFKNLRGQGTLTDENISEAIREIRLALLESDVNLTVVDTLVGQIRTRALGTQVTTALSPSEQIVKIVHDELVNVLGKDTARFRTSSQPPSVILMAGLQGSGKTTTSGKLAQWLKKSGHRPMLVSVDVYRPAAREQLAIVARSTGSQIYEGQLSEGTPGTDAVLRLAREAKREAANYGCDILIVDTAGRNQIDAALMDEMAALKKLLNPSEILFVADAMTGQDAVNSARAFNDLLNITGSILTKMDGDARGGAALSIRHITGAAHQVPRHRRKARRLRALPPRPHRLPHHGPRRHRHPARTRRSHPRPRQGRAVRQEGPLRRRLLPRRLPRTAPSD